jgi:hypothetical protein
MYTEDTIKSLIQYREYNRPATGQVPLEEDYWVKLLRKGDQSPKDLSTGEVFELGVYIERIFQTSIESTQMDAIDFRRHLNEVFGK